MRLLKLKYHIKISDHEFAGIDLFVTREYDECDIAEHVNSLSATHLIYKRQNSDKKIAIQNGIYQLG